MTHWTDNALCATRPSDWWMTGDDGNRLALMLCKLACPALSDCGLYAHDEAGVIRAGVAYADNGRVLDVCPCGRPILGQAHRDGYCRTCEPPKVRIRLRHGGYLPGPGRPAEHPCGTWQAYQRHVRRKEETCPPCRAAMRVRRAERREAKRARQDMALAA